MSKAKATKSNLRARLRALIRDGREVKRGLKDFRVRLDEKISEIIGKEVEDNRELKRRKRAVAGGLLRALNDLENILDQLLKELREQREVWKGPHSLDLPENKIFSTCLSTLARAEAVWYAYLGNPIDCLLYTSPSPRDRG